MMSGNNDTILDTNFLLRYAHEDEPQHPDVVSALERLVVAGGAPFVTNQTLMEFWVVATRPKEVNGSGLSPKETREEIDSLLQVFTLLPDPPDLFPRWLSLCTIHGIRGRPAHDARFIAVMEYHGIQRLLTLNPGDFKRFKQILLLSPSDIP